MTQRERLIPSFVEARSPQGLRSLMFKENLKHRGMVQFFDIQTYIKRGKPYWIAWFYIDLNDETMREVLNGSEEV